MITFTEVRLEVSNKRLGYAMIVIGTVVVLGAVGLRVYSRYSIDKMVSSRVLYQREAQVGGTTENKETSEPSKTPEFSPVDADMNVAPVTVYQNVIEIPSCSITVPITAGIDTASLNAGAGHFTETANIGENGNACYAGHYSTIYNCIFNNLPSIKLYDIVNGYNSKGGKTEYYVISKFVTTPDNISVLTQPEDTKDLTLVTCTENGDMRLIIQCRALSATELETFKKESEKEKRESMYSIADDIGNIEVMQYIKSGEMPEDRIYSLPARKHHERKSTVDTLLNQ